MKTTYFSPTDHNFENIVSINSSETENDEFDFDFDYDPNEMYYALAREND
jgi:hypothetical protein